MPDNQHEHDCIPVRWDIQVILWVDEQKGPCCIGKLVEIGEKKLAFDYLPLEYTFESHINGNCEVNLKNMSGPRIFTNPIPGKIVSDSPVPHPSFSGLRSHRCIVELSEPFAWSDIQAFI
jgi:hypothetical protein